MPCIVIPQNFRPGNHIKTRGLVAKICAGSGTILIVIIKALPDPAQISPVVQCSCLIPLGEILRDDNAGHPVVQCSCLIPLGEILRDDNAGHPVNQFSCLIPLGETPQKAQGMLCGITTKEQLCRPDPMSASKALLKQSLISNTTHNNNTDV
jgi:hypothetical protein